MGRVMLLTFHAEALQKDQVWSRVDRFVRSMERRGVGATFFVYPFPASVSGVDIRDRVGRLVDAGQEVGQHTHFYSGDRISKSDKRNDLSEDNIRLCIERDRDALTAMGVEPKGFLAGAWIVTPDVLRTLTDLGYSYDCSARIGDASGEDAGLRWLDRPTIIEGPKGDLVRLPTSCSLGGWFRGGRKTAAGAPERFQIVYLHDYELLRARTRWLLNLFLWLNRKRMSTVGADLERLATRGSM